MTMALGEMLRRRLDPEQRYGLRLTLFVLAILLVALPFGVLLREVTTDGRLTELDTVVANELHEEVRESPGLVTVLQAISFLGSPIWFYIVITAAAVYLWKRGHPRLAVFLAVTTLLGGVIDTIVKEVVARPRPSLEAPVATARGKSFPSGHSMTAAVAYGALLLVFLPEIPRRWRVPIIAGAALLVLAIGGTRLALGVHYITDVLGGFVLGLAWLFASTAAFSIWKVERGKRPVEVSDGLAPEEF